MGIPEAVRTANGTWHGSNLLYLPDESPREATSSAVVTSIAQGQFCTLSYTWSFDGQPQDGLLLIGQADGQNSTTVAWVDSWHMGDKMMLCSGALGSADRISVRGSYQVEGHPDWGWRIDIMFASAALGIDMYNISPEGEETVAVQAQYTREA